MQNVQSPSSFWWFWVPSIFTFFVVERGKNCLCWIFVSYLFYVVPIVTLKYWKRCLWLIQGSIHHCFSFSLLKLLDFLVGHVILSRMPSSGWRVFGTCLICSWCPRTAGTLKTSLCRYADLCRQSGAKCQRIYQGDECCQPLLPASHRGCWSPGFLIFFFFLLIPSRVLSFLFWFYRGMNWTREWAGEPEKAGAAGNALRESSE